MRTSPRTARTIGWLTIISALAGTALALVIMFWPVQGPDTRWSYPFDAAAYTLFQTSFFVHDVTLIPGLVLVAVWAWPRASRAARIGLGLTVASMTAGAVIELSAVAAAASTQTSTAASVLGAAYGMMSLGFGVGFIMAGAELHRRPLTQHPLGRWTYLLIGIWTFFPMLPSLFMPMIWGRITIGIWFLLFAGIGVIILRHASSTTSATAPQSGNTDGIALS